MPEPTVAYFQGDYRSFEEARVSIRCKAVNYGIGCFEGIRAYWNARAAQLYVFRCRDHYERLHNSCKIIRLPLPLTVEQLTGITVELLRRNDHREDVYIRPIVYSGSERLSPTLTTDGVEFAMYTLPLRDYLDASKGVTACVSSWRRVSENMIPARAKPTGVYLNSALARDEARTNGYDEAILLTQDGYVSEASAEHIFLVRGGTLVTPTTQEDNLEGITRRVISELVRSEMGRGVVERRVSRTELYTADEAFLCGTGAEITPLVEVDRRKVGDGRPGPITKELQGIFIRAVRGELPKYASWCTPVYGA
jgi:branched-chain amino acid aminotransferase